MKIKYNPTNFKLNYKQPTPKEFTNDTTILVADFEVSRVSDESEDVFVYSTAYMNVEEETDNCYHNFNVLDFMENITNQPTAKTIVAFHNLSYDIVSILTEYIYPKFKQIQNSYTKSHDGVVKVKRGARKIIVDNIIDDEVPKDIKPYTYEIIYANGSFYCLDLYLEEITVKVSGRNKKKLKHIRFIDTLKIINQDLKTVADKFLGYEISKSDLDHNIIRSKNYIPTEDEKVYIYEDVKVLKDLLYITKVEGIYVNDKYTVKFNKMTTASQALNEYKKLIYSDFLTQADFTNSTGLQHGKEVHEAQIKYFIEKGRKFNPTHDDFFSCIFPPLPLDTDSFNRGSYFGGITWVNEDLVNKYTSKGKPLKGLVYDVNSMYPYVMRNKLLPYGKPQYFTGDFRDKEERFKNEYPLYIQKVRIEEFIIKPNKMPMIQVKNNPHFSATEYLKDNKAYNEFTQETDFEPVILTLTNIQLNMMLDSYTFPMGITYLEGYAFKGSYGLFNTYIDLFMTLKKSKNKTQKALAKLMLNSLYGKFGTNPVREERIIQVFDGIFTTTNRNKEGELLNYLTDSIYLPIATFVTSYARELLVTTVNAIGVTERVLYTDTDSVHILDFEEPTNINIHPNELGAWKLEGMFSEAKYIGAKRYAEKIIYKDDTKEELVKPSTYSDKETYFEEWQIKCCGVAAATIQKLDDIEAFEVCELNGKKIKELIKDKKLYTNDSIYYFYDSACTQKVKGLLHSKKKKYVKGGILISPTPYAITKKTYVMR